jgi:hypothetical protein
MFLVGDTRKNSNIYNALFVMDIIVADFFYIDLLERSKSHMKSSIGSADSYFLKLRNES